jgi:hypothetical protein
VGRRIKLGEKEYIIYKNHDFEIIEKDNRRLNHRVFFRIPEYKPIKFDGKEYILISIPGDVKLINQNDKEINQTATYPLSGKEVSKYDFDQMFWVEKEVVENKTNKEYLKYSNDFFSGLLTAPFKYRLKLGNAPEGFIGGDFNIAPFLGWKIRTSGRKNYSISPFLFSGVTSLNYNSSNNKNITDSQANETGSGLTYGGGLSITLGDISPGIVAGFDHGLGNLGNGFIYKDKLWLSFSIHYDFIKPNVNKDPKNRTD